jgi:hypothetical protein
MTQTTKPEKSREAPLQGKLGDWPEWAQGHGDLLFELERFDARERVPRHRQVTRARAKAIIEGRARWPRELLPWKTWRELKYYHGNGPLPSWEDEANLTRPQRECIESEVRAFRRRLAEYEKSIESRRPAEGRA